MALPRIGRTSIPRRWFFCASPQSASYSENLVNPLDVSAEILRLRTLAINGAPADRRPIASNTASDPIAPNKHCNKIPFEVRLHMDAFFNGLRKPPLVLQTGAKCWAAALASWLAVVRKKGVSMNDLVTVFDQFLVYGGNGALRSDKIDDVVTSEYAGMAWKIVGTGGLTHDFLASFLDPEWPLSSHIYLILNFGNSDISHARVLYRTVPYSFTDDFTGEVLRTLDPGIKMMDPMIGYGIWTHKEAAQFKCLVGIRKECVRSWMDKDWNS
jgi:hypothetical protein